MKKIFPVLFIAFLLAWCAQNWQNVEQTPEAESITSAPTNTWIQIEKAEDCAKYCIQNEEDMKKFNDATSKYKMSLWDCFYSPKLKTCMGSTKDEDNSYFLDNLVTKDELRSSGGLFSRPEDEYQKKVQELKWN